MTENVMHGFDKWQFSSDAMDGKPAQFDVYSKGDGPVIVLIQELPGIFKETLRLVDWLVDAGFRVVMPHLFGPLGKFAIGSNLVRVFCMRREFSLFSKNKTSPITAWLKALCVHAKEKYNVKGVGVMGMCLTGNFAISMMADDSVLAGVSGQPSLPLFNAGAIHMSDDEVADVRKRLEEKGPMLAYRFKGDVLCGKAKFPALNKALNGDQERIKLTEIEGNAHAIFTGHFIDEEGSPTQKAVDEVIEYFKDKLAA